jgi:transposase-like protein
VNGLPRKIVIDRSGANTAGINTINRMRKRFGCPVPIAVARIKSLISSRRAPRVRANHRGGEQHHRTIKTRVRPMLGFKTQAALAEKERVNRVTVSETGRKQGTVKTLRALANALRRKAG